MSLLLGIITFLYIFILLFLLYGFRGQPDFSGKNFPIKTTFTIIIPFRDEAAHLPRLLISLKNLNYPKTLFEILLVNDDSIDTSQEICQEFISKNPDLKLRLLQNQRFSGSPKKDAITTGIKLAKNNFIITTDADCQVPQDWLREHNAHYVNNNSKMVAGPAAAIPENNFLSKFQELDFFSLQVATMGGFGVNQPFMCNGANLSYSKKAFNQVNGFEGNDFIGSGDDVFLLEKFRKQGLKITFLKSHSAVVSTALQKTWSGLFSQRIRWTAKTSAYENNFGKAVGLLVLLMNLFLILALLGTLSGFLSPKILLLPFLLKFNIDFLLIYNGAYFFGRENVLKHYFMSSLLYPFFSCAVAIFSLFKGYNWKGRQFKK